MARQDLTEAELKVLDKLHEASNTLALHLTSEEQDIADDLEERGWVSFYDDGQGFDIIVNKSGRPRRDIAEES